MLVNVCIILNYQHANGMRKNQQLQGKRMEQYKDFVITLLCHNKTNLIYATHTYLHTSIITLSRMASMWCQLMLQHLNCFFISSDSAVCFVTISYMAKGNKMYIGLHVVCQLSDLHQHFFRLTYFRTFMSISSMPTDRET